MLAKEINILFITPFKHKHDKFEFAKRNDKLGFYYESYGIPKIGGRILGYILLLDGPATAENISSVLEISRASVSTNLCLSFKLMKMRK